MRLLVAGVMAVLVMSGTVAFGQKPERLRDTRLEEQQPPANMSPETWAYLQEMRRQDDPKLNARRAAQFKAEQRRLRLASQQWYGVSNLRPIVNPIPFMGNYSPMWSGNPADGAWYPTSHPRTVQAERPLIYAR